jgi:hypothetical protein
MTGTRAIKPIRTGVLETMEILKRALQISSSRLML